jgi:hypothetical protein
LPFLLPLLLLVPLQPQVPLLQLLLPLLLLFLPLHLLQLCVMIFGLQPPLQLFHLLYVVLPLPLLLPVPLLLQEAEFQQAFCFGRLHQTLQIFISHLLLLLLLLLLLVHLIQQRTLLLLLLLFWREQLLKKLILLLLLLLLIKMVPLRGHGPSRVGYRGVISSRQCNPMVVCGSWEYIGWLQGA